ncbi:hypothetical protein MAHJHV60_45910 [Mycobacterium avium subsp. hominissuis]
MTPSSTATVLEGVNDHENLGAIFRNAAGLGVDAVIFGSGCADPLYRRVAEDRAQVLMIVDPLEHRDGAAWPRR